MEEPLIAKLTIVKGFKVKEKSGPTQTAQQKYIREKRGVHIEIHRGASGYYWSMCRSDSGTNLGWSGYSGPNKKGAWNEFEDALENAIQTQLSLDLKMFEHWSDYARKAIEAKKLIG